MFIRTRISQTRNRCDDVNGKYGLNEREKERHTQTKIQKERKKERKAKAKRVIYSAQLLIKSDRFIEILQNFQ